MMNISRNFVSVKQPRKPRTRNAMDEMKRLPHSDSKSRKLLSHINWNKITSKNLIFAHIYHLRQLVQFAKKKIVVPTYQELIKSGVIIVVWKPPNAHILEPDLLIDVFCKQAAKTKH